MAAVKRRAAEADTTASKATKRARGSDEGGITEIAQKSAPHGKRESTGGHSESGKQAEQERKPKQTYNPYVSKTKLANGSKGANGGDNKFKLTTSSAEAHAAQKALAKERKESKPNADVVARSKKIWERLRRQSHVEKGERDELVAELYAIINGRVRDFVFKHDSVRVIQCAIKYANKEQRLNITRELRTDMRPLVESKYGKFMVAKLVVEGDQEIRDLIIPEFYGHIRKLINHPEAAWIVDDIYRGVATPDQKAHMLREWYGAEFALDNKLKDTALKASAKVTADLSRVLAESPEKRKPIMTALHQLINQLVQKKMTGFTMLHDAMLQYFTNVPAGSEEASEFMENLRSDLDEESGGGDLLKNLAFTKSGSRVVCLALAYGNAKARKQILRVYRGVVEAMALDTHAYKVLLVALEVTDDTKASAAAVYSELLYENIKDDEERAERIAAILTHLTARVPILRPIAHDAKWLIPADLSQLLKDIYTIRETTSKKAPATRSAELAKYLAAPLLGVIATAAGELIQSTTGCQAMTEILLSSPAHVEAQGELTRSAVEAVAALCAGDPADETHVSHIPAAGKMLRTLSQGGRFDREAGAVVKAEPDVGFAAALHRVIDEHVLAWATGPSSFVVLALVEGGLQEGERGKLVRKLGKGRKALEKAAGTKGADGKVNGGANLILEKL